MPTATLNALAGDDTFDLNGNQTFTTVNLHGGDGPDADVLRLSNNAGAAIIDLGNATISGYGGTIRHTGLNSISANGNAKALTIQATTADDRVEATPLDSTTIRVNADRVPTTITVTNSATFTVDTLSGNDRLVVNGSTNSETIIATGSQVAVDGRQPVQFANSESLLVNGLAGSDVFQVTPSATTEITVDGGDPIGTTAGDTINLLAGGATVTLETGSENDEGGFITSGRQRVSFDHIELASVTGAGGASSISGTPGDDVVTITARDQSTHSGTDGVNDFTTIFNDGLEILWIDTPTFAVNTLGGADTISILAPAPSPAGPWDVDLSIDGGQPADRDTVILSSRGTNQARYTPTGIDAGVLALVDQNATSTLVGIENVIYDGNAGGDTVTVIGTVSADLIRVIPTGQDAAQVQVNQLLGLQIRALGSAGSLVLDGQGAADELSVTGRSTDDQFNVAAGGPGTAITLNQFVPMFSTAIESLTLLGADGNDQFRIVTNTTVSTINVQAGNPNTSGDSLTVVGTSGIDDAFDVTHTGVGSGAVQETITGKTVLFTGVESLGVEGNGTEDRLTIADTGNDDRFVIGSGETGDQISGATITPIHVTGSFNTLTVALDRRTGNDQLSVDLARLRAAGTYRVDANPVELDQLVVLGTEGRDRITSTATSITVAQGTAAKTLQLTSGELHLITLRSLGGNDNVVITGLSDPRVIEAGDGNDYVEDNGPTATTVFGGDGDDTIRTDGGADSLDGGRGNDFLFAGSGTDILRGGDGNDLLVGGAGNDSLFGGDGSDTLVWNPGDANDVMEGDAGTDALQFVGGSVADQFTISAVGSRIKFERQPNNIVIDAAGLEQIDTNVTATFSGTLAGSQEVPPVTSTGSGAAHLTFNSATGTFDLDVFVEGISQSNLTNAHIHLGAVGVDGGVVVDIGSGSSWIAESGGLRRSLKGVAFPAGNAAGLLAGNTYVNIHTSANPDGELRAQLNRAATAQDFSGGDSFVVRDLTQAGVRVVNLGLGVNDSGETDQVAIHGRQVADDVTVAMNGSLINVVGLAYDINVSNSGVGEDDFTFLGNSGDDVITVDSGLAARFGVDRITTDGGPGNDTLTGYGRLLGQAGNDTLIGDDSSQQLVGGADNDQLFGGAGADRLNGDAGEDVFVGGLGTDTVDGGDGFDTVLVSGTSAADTIDVKQTTDTSITYSVNTATETDVLVSGSVEEVRVDAGSGADTIRATIVDSLFDDPGLSLQITVHGGSGTGVGDRLIVVDDGTDDLAVYRKMETSSEGTVTVGPANAEPFEHVVTGIERVQVVDEAGVALNAELGAGARLVTFSFDGNELNDDRFEPTPLGVNRTLAVNPAIDAIGLTSPFNDAFDLPSDQDWYRIEAETTGTLDIRVFFEEIGQIGQRPGLPGNGNLNIELFDADGTLIAGNGIFGDNDGRGEFNLDGDSFGENERIRIPAVQGQVYLLRVAGATTGAVNNYSVTVLNAAPPRPFALELQDTPLGNNSDTGPSNQDNITADSTPTLFLRVDDGVLRFDVPGNDSATTPPDQLVPIPFQTTAGVTGYRIAIFDEGPTPSQSATNPQTPLGFATEVAGSPGLYTFTSPVPLSNGSHFLTARVQMIDPATPQQTGFGPRSESLEVVIDAVGSPAFFGEPGVNDDGLQTVAGDTGLDGQPATFTDRITSNTRPTLWGAAEAGVIVRLYFDRDNDGAVGTGDVLLGVTTADPTGTNQGPGGLWEITSRIDLNDSGLASQDGLRQLLVTGEDHGGNVSAAERLSILLDTRGPQVTGLAVNSRTNTHNLFAPLPSIDGPTPAVTSLVIGIRDLANRSNASATFLAPVLGNSVATQPGSYSIVGDKSGAIAIRSVTLTADPATNGQPATGAITLIFFAPLPDDRYTLQFADALADPAGNRFDGEANAREPQSAPVFPSGNGRPGGNWTARFTVDSRPEIGVFTGSTVQVDANGNGVFDPDGQGNDAVNRDLTFQQSLATDIPFTGDFTPALATSSSTFGKLGSYGFVNQVWRFLLDFNHDGAPDFMSVPDNAFQSAPIPGLPTSSIGSFALPIAGNFSNSKAGDEIGLFDPFNLGGNLQSGGMRWILDSNGDNVLNASDTVIAIDVSTYSEFTQGSGGTQSLAASLYPVIGDFNGDGNDDLGLYDRVRNRFSCDLNRDGKRDDVIEWGFADVETPIAGDVNRDGIDDLGLWLPDSPAGVVGSQTGTNQAADGVGEWYFLVSDRAAAAPSAIFDVYAPTPLGNDEFAKFGASGAQPVFANFDPPPFTDSSTVGVDAGMSNPNDPFDVNGDGRVVPIDVLVVINALNEVGGGKLPDKVLNNPRFVAPKAYLDANRDGSLAPFDALVIINHLHRAQTEGEGERTLFVEVMPLPPPATSETVHHDFVLPATASCASGNHDQVVASLAEDLAARRRQRLRPVPSVAFTQQPEFAPALLETAAEDSFNVELAEILDELKEAEVDRDSVDQIFGDWS